MNELFTVGQMAKLFNINVKTLRYYDSIELLKPEKVDLENGYRYYSSSQIERLNTIKYLRKLEMPIDKIKEFFEDKDIDTLKRLLLKQKEETAKKIQQMLAIERKINNRLKQIEAATSSSLNTIIKTHFENRPVVMLKRTMTINSDIEPSIRELELTNNIENSIFLGKVGFTISNENLKIGQYSQFSGVFLLLEDDDLTIRNVEYIKENDYLVYSFSGTHYESEKHYKAIAHYMAENQYVQCDDAIEITLIDYGITNDRSKFITEIQIPYKD